MTTHADESLPHTIQVVNYCGDYDDLRDILVIGPYPDAASRATDLYRLANLPGVYGSLILLPSTIPPAAARRSCTPQQVAGAADLDGITAALWPDDGAVP